METVSWGVAVPLMVCTIFAQAVSGLVYSWLIWPRVGSHEITKLMFLAFGATTPMVLAGGLLALIGRQAGDVVIAFACFTMWVGQLPFMFAGLPVLDYLLDEQRRLQAKERDLAGVRDGAS